MSRLINSSPVISSSGVSNHGAPSKFQVSSIMQPTRSNNSSPSLEDGDSIPEMIRLIWSRFGEVQVDLAVCFPRVLPLPAILLPDRGPHQHGCTGTQLASGPSQVCVSPSESARTDTLQGQGGRGAGLAGYAFLAHQDLVFETHAPHDSPSLAHPPETRLLSRSPETRPGYMPNVSAIRW